MPETNTPQPDGPGDENTPEGARDMYDEVVLPEKKFTSGDGGVSGLKKSTIALSFLAGAALAGGVAALATFDLGSHGKVVADPGASPTSVSASPFPSQSSASGSASSTSSSTSSSPSKSAGGSPTSSAPGGSQTAAPSGGPSRPSSGASSSTPSSSSQVSPGAGSSSTGSGSQPSNGPVTENGGSDSGSTSAPTDQNSSNGSNTRQPNNESNAQRRPSRTPGTSANTERIASTWRSHVDTLRSGVSLYTVQDGDTLSELAQVMGTSVERLASLNHIRDVDLIRTGQSLRLPLGVHR